MESKCYVSGPRFKPKVEICFLKEYHQLKALTDQRPYFGSQQQSLLLGTLQWLIELQCVLVPLSPSIPPPCVCVFMGPEDNFKTRYYSLRHNLLFCFVFEQCLLGYTDQHHNSTSFWKETWGVHLPLPSQLLGLQVYSNTTDFLCELIKFRSSSLQGKHFTSWAISIDLYTSFIDKETESQSSYGTCLQHSQDSKLDWLSSTLRHATKILWFSEIK